MNMQLGQLKPRVLVDKTGTMYPDYISDETMRRYHEHETWFWHSEPGVFWSRPEIVTLVGSTRFVDEFNFQRQRFTLDGAMVWSIEIVTTQAADEDPQHVDPKTKALLDALHFEKIRHSDSIFVINKGRYIGDSTRREIQYAQFLGLPIEYLENL